MASKKKTTTSKRKNKIENTNEEIIADESKNNIDLSIVPEPVVESSDQQIEKSEVITEKGNEDLIRDPSSLDDKDLQLTYLTLSNENNELKASLEKAKKMIRILKKKLDLSEEREEQWRVCAHNMGGMFAEKTQMSLEDVFRKFEAPLDDIAL